MRMCLSKVGAGNGYFRICAGLDTVEFHRSSPKFRATPIYTSHDGKRSSKLHPAAYEGEEVGFPSTVRRACGWPLWVKPPKTRNEQMFGRSARKTGHVDSPS